MTSDEVVFLHQRCYSFVTYGARNEYAARSAYSFVVNAYRKVYNSGRKKEAMRFKQLAERFLPALYRLYESEFQRGLCIINVQDNTIPVEVVDVDKTRRDMNRRAKLRAGHIYS